MQSIKVLSCALVLVLSLISGKYGYKIENDYDGSYYLLNQIVPAVGVEEVEYNVIECSTIHVSNTVLNLVLDGFSIEKSTLDEEVIDIVLVKEDIQYRVIYQKSTGKMTLLSNPYENISILKTYINRE